MGQLDSSSGQRVRGLPQQEAGGQVGEPELLGEPPALCALPTPGLAEHPDTGGQAGQGQGRGRSNL